MKTKKTARKRITKRRANHPPTMRFRRALFWDVNPKTIDPEKHARYIIERVMDFGNDQEVRWVWRTYSASLLQDIAKNSRVLHPQTRALWKILIPRYQ